MTTYNSYEAAKIDNPDSNIWHLNGRVFASENQTNAPSGVWGVCNPSGCCMTVEKFLADGYRFVEGDIVLNGTRVKTISKNVINTMNMPSYCDKHTFILRAAALEENAETESEYEKGMREAMKKIAVSCGRVFGADAGYEDLPDLVDNLINPPEKKPRTKVEYVPCHFADAWEPVKSYCNGDELFDGDKNKVACPEVALNLWIHGNLYRRIETPMTEREEFVDGYEKLVDGFMGDEAKNADDWAGYVFDKLVN